MENNTGKRVKGFWQDFKAFISKGNILDLAIAVVIGAAFGKIVTSLVGDIIMPLVSLIIGGANFADLRIVLRPEVVEAGVVTQTELAIRYGVFIQAILDFLIIALCIFLIFRIIRYASGNLNRALSKLERKAKKTGDATVAAPEPTADAELAPMQIEAETPDTNAETIALLTEIRDLLKQK